MSDNHNTENSVVYKTLDDYPGYRFGDDGSVWTCRKKGYPQGKLGNEWTKFNPKLRNKTRDYARHFLNLTRKNGKKIQKEVGCFILEAFIGKCPEGYQCRYLNDNPSDNNLKNLKWGTHPENTRNRRRIGMAYHESRHSCDVLDEQKVKEIKIMISQGYDNKIIYEKYWISPSLINSIRDKKIWKHVKV